MPAPPLVITLALLGIAWVLTSVTLAEWTAFAVAVVAASVIFLLRRRQVQQRSRHDESDDQHSR